MKSVVVEYHEDHKDFKDDLLVTYDPSKLTAQRILEVIRGTGLHGTIIPESSRPKPP